MSEALWVARAESNGGSAWESNPLRALILKDLRRFPILPILGFLSFAVVNPQIAPSRRRRLTGFLIEDPSMAPCGALDRLLVAYGRPAVAARRRVSDGSSPKQSR